MLHAIGKKQKSQKNAAVRSFVWLLDKIAPVTPVKMRAQPKLTAEDDPFRQLGFTFALIALSVKLIKISGELTRDEYLAFRGLFPFDDAESSKLRRLFMLAWADESLPELYARRIMQLYPNNPKLYENVINELYRVACADEGLSNEKDIYIKNIANVFKVNYKEISEGIRRQASNVVNPYRLLGLPVSASRQEVKSRYHSLMRQYHPDRVMATAQYPETLALAMIKSAEINEAYQKIGYKKSA